MYAKKGVSAKAVALLLAVVLIIGCVVGGTIAFLKDTSEIVVNTFTTANIDITLEETWNTDSDNNGTNDCWTAKMVPGTAVDKDPTVIVVGGSESCWLFVKVEESAGFDNYVTYAIADGWTALPGAEGVYYREVTAAEADQSFGVLAGNTVSIKETVTKEMMDALETAGAPTLTFTAYAVQKEGFNSAAAAWEEAQKLS